MASLAQPPSPSPPEKVLITELLRRLWPAGTDPLVEAQEIAEAIALIFTDQLSPVQTGALLTCLNFTGRDRHADVIALSAEKMRDAADQMDLDALQKFIEAKKETLSAGHYRGGLCDIVGTGGDNHHTYNISTTSSIIASSLLLISKHGNRASTSKSGSADLLTHALTPLGDATLAPILTNITPTTIHDIYAHTNYAFLYAPVFHKAMRYVAPIRKELGWRTIFNLLGPLSNPLEAAIESRLIGVARRDLGPVFANALAMAGARKAIIACGAEDLDEVSCAGVTYCWMLDDGEGGWGDRSIPPEVKAFTIQPSDFGLPAHPLTDVSGGKEPEENAAILLKILKNELEKDDPLIDFVLMNTATLLVASGICEADTSNMGSGDDGQVIKERGPGGQRWKEGVRRARWAIQSGAAYKQWESFVEVTNSEKVVSKVEAKN